MCGFESVFPEVQPDFISASDKCEPRSQVGCKEPVYLKGNFCQSKGQVLSLFLLDAGRKLLLRLEVQQGRRKMRDTAFMKTSLESWTVFQATLLM